MKYHLFSYSEWGLGENIFIELCRTTMANYRPCLRHSQKHLLSLKPTQSLSVHVVYRVNTACVGQHLLNVLNSVPVTLANLPWDEIASLSPQP